jgi:hypothetical protein
MKVHNGKRVRAGARRQREDREPREDEYEDDDKPKVPRLPKGAAAAAAAAAAAEEAAAKGVRLRPLVSRARAVPADRVAERLAALIGDGDDAGAPASASDDDGTAAAPAAGRASSSVGTSAFGPGGGLLALARRQDMEDRDRARRKAVDVNATVKERRKEQLLKKNKLEIVDGRAGAVVDVVGGTEAARKAKLLRGGDASDDEAAEGDTLLRKELREQNHTRQLPHQARHDYEFRLRRVATSGAVQLFNALAQAQSAGTRAQEEAEKTATEDKAAEYKHVASRDAFLAALRGAAALSAKK